MMKNNPYIFLGLSIAFPLFFSGYTMRIFERPLEAAPGEGFDLLSNNLWTIYITMMTIGYGDYYPKSNLGRLVGIIACFWGNFIVSVFVVTLTNLLKFQLGELKSYDILSKLRAKEML